MEIGEKICFNFGQNANKFPILHSIHDTDPKVQSNSYFKNRNNYDPTKNGNLSEFYVNSKYSESSTKNEILNHPNNNHLIKGDKLYQDKNIQENFQFIDQIRNNITREIVRFNSLLT